jgi:hypothetical protein
MSTGIIPSKAETCTLDISVSEVDCSPSSKLANQISAEHTNFDKAKFAKGGYTLLTVKYKSEESISGFQFELEIPKHHTKIAAIGTKIGTNSKQTSETSAKNFIVFSSKNTVIGILNPEVSGSAVSTSYNLSSQTADTNLCFILLEKSQTYTDKGLCPEEVSIKNVRACRNLNSSNASVLGIPKSNWKGKISSNTGLSDIYFASKLLATKTYEPKLDANNDGEIDIVDITTLANKRHNILYNKHSTDIVPQYICKDHDEFVTKSDLKAELSIVSTEIVTNESEDDLYDLHVTFGIRSTNSTAGFQFDFGKDLFNDTKGREKVELLGPLKTLEETWAYKFESFRNRFDRDAVTRFMVYQLPIDVNNVQLKNDVETLEQVLSTNSLEPLKTLTPVIKYSIIGCDLNGDENPEPRYFYADDLAFSADKKEIKKSKRKGDRYYGRVNKRPDGFYTGDRYNPKTSRRLNSEFDVFELFNERIVTNDFVNYFEHSDNNLKYAGFDLVYDIDSKKLSDHFDNDLESYFKYIINYLYLPLRNGLSSQFSAYDYEPSGSVNPAHNGFISDSNLSGRKDICDTIALVNIATQKLSSVESTTLKVLKDLAGNDSNLSDHETSNSSTGTTVCEDEAETRYNLKSLTKVVPTFILENFTNTTFPHHKPSIVDQKTEAAIVHFSDKVDASGSNYPAEFKNWSEYFNDIHDVRFWQTPEENEFTFVNVNLATNSRNIGFINSAEFMIDFNNAYSSATNHKFWIYPGKGFQTGSHTLTVRAASASGSILQATGSTIGASGSLYIKLEVSSSTSLATPITYDGGALNLVKMFFTDVPDYVSGKYVELTSDPSSGSIQSVGKPLERFGSANYVSYTTSDKLVYGPKLSYLSDQFKDNSTSQKVFGDTVIRLRAVGPSEVDVEYDTIKPFNSASFEFRAIDGIEVTIDETIHLPSETDATGIGYTASVSSARANDGKTTVTIHSPTGTAMTGSGTLLRLKTDRQLFPYEVLQTGKEVMTPPKGVSGDLIIPNIVKTSIFPQVSNLKFHIDTSNHYWSETKVSGTSNVINTLANPYGIGNLTQTHMDSQPLLTSVTSSFKQGLTYASFNATASLQLLSSSANNNDLDAYSLEKFTIIGVIDPLTLAGDWTKTIFKASSSLNSITVNLKGKTTYASEGALSLVMSGSAGGTRTVDMSFGSTSFTGKQGHVFIIRSDGTDTSGATATNIRVNGSSVTSSYSSLDSADSTATVNYVMGGACTAGTASTNHETYYHGNVGEIILFNEVLTDEIVEIFEGYASHKWGLDSYLPSNHKYFGTAPDTSNTTTNNISTKAAIDKSETYFPGSGSTSDRASSRLFSKFAGLASVTITSGSTGYTNPSYDDLRELPKEVNVTASFAADTELFIKSYDERTGLLVIGYSSERNVDGYWLQLGNTYSGSAGQTVKQVGLIGTDQKDRSSQCYEKRWSQYVGFGPNESAIYNKDPRKTKSIKQIAFGFAQGLVGKAKKVPKDFYRNSGSYYIPSTPSGETGILTQLRVDTKSFKGIPTIKSYKMVTNDRSTTPAASWTGDTSGGTVGFDDLNTVIKQAQQGFYKSGHPDTGIAAEATKFDAGASGSAIDIVDVLTVFNHLMASNGPASTNLTLKTFPRNCSETLVTAPGAPTVTATADPCASGSSVSLEWTTGSGGMPSGYEIWRRGSSESGNKSDRSKLFLFTGDRDALYKKTAKPYEKIKTITTGTILAYLDKEPPYNHNCCEDADNPKIDYIIISFNEGGEITGQSNTVQLECCNEVPVARNIILTSSINTPVSFTADVTEGNAAPPFGTADTSIDDPEVLQFRILDYGNGSLDSLKNNDGNFTFSPDRDYIGNTQIEYEVSNEAGCKDRAIVFLQFTPAKFTAQAKVMKPSLNMSASMPVQIQFDREDVRGNILKYEIYRAVGSASYSGTPYRTISGKLPVTERFVTFYDDSLQPIEGHTGSYRYKIKAYGFQGNPDEAITKSRFSTVETDDIIVNIPARTTGSNPVVTVSSSFFNDADHPLVKLSWNSASAGSRDVSYYKVYRILKGQAKYEKVGIVKYNGGSSYLFLDNDLPDPDNFNKYGVESYGVKYRLTSVSDDGENGDPNRNWGGSTSEASISGSTVTPLVKDKTFAVCAGVPFSASVSDLVTNHAVGSTTFSASTDHNELNFTTSTGDFNITKSNAGAITFTYAATSGHKKSADATITLNILDCSDGVAPAGTAESHIITDSYDVQGQYTKTVDQVPFGLKEKGGQNIRSANTPSSVSQGEIKSED